MHHLMRVRIRKSVFAKLQSIAKSESHLHKDYTSVSDIVRAALATWIQTHDNAYRIETTMANPAKE
jgi:Arc/MetJ-type ribon-helix-helix transcriptional regulator